MLEHVDVVFVSLISDVFGGMLITKDDERVVEHVDLYFVYLLIDYGSYEMNS